MSTTTTPQQNNGLAPIPAHAEPASLYRYSTWLHAGLGAEQCEEVDENEGANRCGDAAHFHAWCRLPNPLQQAQIRERALAAKARKIRQLRDPASDSYDILEEEFDRRARLGDSARSEIIDELIALDWFRDYYAAIGDAKQIDADGEPPEGEEPVKRFAQIDDDQARFTRLAAMSEDQRPKDEYEELQRHLESYQKEIDAALAARTEPKRAALESLDLNALLEQLRDKRVEAEASREFGRVFDIHQWLSCTYRAPGDRHAFDSLEALEGAAPEIIDGLQSVFADLARTAQEARGN